MNTEQRHIARVLFKLRVFRSDGQAYEDLFTSVLQKQNPNFIQIKPQGRLGDKKNDGFDRKTGTYYQCYAPEDLEDKESTAKSKLKTDFEGLLKNWNDSSAIKVFGYVLNDKYKGCYPSIAQELLAIKKQHSLDDAFPFLNKDLEAALFTLDPDVIYEIIGSVPSVAMDQTIQLSALGEVVEYLIKNMEAKLGSGKLVAPDFDKKIAFNKLSSEVGQILKDGNYQVHVLESFFATNTNQLKGDLRNILANLYADSLDQFKELNENERADVVFFNIANQAFPNQRHAHQQAIFVLMAYFFEACDIFEEPKENL